MCEGGVSPPPGPVGTHILPIEMIKQIERQIRDLQRDLMEVQREWTSLRLQPCKGDMELRRKEGKLEGLDKRIRTFRESIRELERKRQEMLSQPFKKEGYQSPFF
jgi:chromosome segregation ATPase